MKSQQGHMTCHSLAYHPGLLLQDATIFSRCLPAFKGMGPVHDSRDRASKDSGWECPEGRIPGVPHRRLCPPPTSWRGGPHSGLRFIEKPTSFPAIHGYRVAIPPSSAGRKSIFQDTESVVLPPSPILEQMLSKNQLAFTKHAVSLRHAPPRP